MLALCCNLFYIQKSTLFVIMHKLRIYLGSLPSLFLCSQKHKLLCMSFSNIVIFVTSKCIYTQGIPNLYEVVVDLLTLMCCKSLVTVNKLQQNFCSSKKATMVFVSNQTSNKEVWKLTTRLHQIPPHNCDSSLQ